MAIKNAGALWELASLLWTPLQKYQFALSGFFRCSHVLGRSVGLPARSWEIPGDFWDGVWKQGGTSEGSIEATLQISHFSPAETDLGFLEIN